MAIFSEKFKSISLAPGKPFMSITKNGITFNKACLARLGFPSFVTPLINEEEKIFALLVCDETANDSISFVKNKNKDINVRYNSATFIDTIADTMGWDIKSQSFKVYGEYIAEDNEIGMLFDLNKAEVSESEDKTENC